MEDRQLPMQQLSNQLTTGIVQWKGKARGSLKQCHGRSFQNEIKDRLNSDCLTDSFI